MDDQTSTPETTPDLRERVMPEADIPVSDLLAEQTSIMDAVTTLQDEKAPLTHEEREKLYEDTLNYFLDDENDVIENPIVMPITVVREIELANGETGEREVFHCEIRTLSDTEIKECRRRAREKRNGPNGMTMAEESDEALMYTLMGVEAITKPNIYDKRLMDKHGAPERLLQRMMLPGERVTLGQQILRLSGFGDSIRSTLSASELQDIAAAKS